MFPDPTIRESSPEEIIAHAGRDANNLSDRQWLRNTLNGMRDSGFIERVCDPAGTGKRTKLVRLTPAGLKALGRIEPADVLVRLEQLHHDIERLREQLPSFDIAFRLTPKDQD